MLIRMYIVDKTSVEVYIISHCVASYTIPEVMISHRTIITNAIGNYTKKASPNGSFNIDFHIGAIPYIPTGISHILP